MPPMSRVFERGPALVALAAAAVFLTLLGAPSLWDEDEPRNAACAREMLERGDYVVPTFNFELRTAKPVLLYWLQIASYRAFGVNEFAARLPSALLAILTSLLVEMIGRRLFGPRAGLLAGLALASCLMFGVSGRAATPDSTLVFCTTASLALFVVGVDARQPGIFRGEGQAQRIVGGECTLGGGWRDFLPLRWGWWAGMYAALGLAVLAKGPVGAILPVAGLGLFLLVAGRDGQRPVEQQTAAVSGLSRVLRRLGNDARLFLAVAWSMRPVPSLLAFALIAVPWYVWVGLRTDGAWLRTFFGAENLGRFRNPQEGHSGPFFYYAPAVLVGFFPWSIFLPISVWQATRGLRHTNPQRPAALLMLCWIGVWIGAFSLAGTKLPSYALPAYPALAVLTGAFIDRWLSSPESVPRWLMGTAWISLGLVGAALIVGLPFVAWKLSPGLEWLGAVGLVPLAMGGLAAYFFHRSEMQKLIAAFSVGAVLFCVACLAVAAASVSDRLTSPYFSAVAREAAGDSGGKVRLGTWEHSESSLVYYARGPIQRLSGLAEAEAFLASGPDAMLLTSSARYEELRGRLPSDVEVLARKARFFKPTEVVLLGRKGSGTNGDSRLRAAWRSRENQ